MYLQFAILIFKMFAFSVALYRIHVMKVKIRQKGPAHSVFKARRRDLMALRHLFFAVMRTRCINVFPSVASDFDSATDNSFTEVTTMIPAYIYIQTLLSFLFKINKQTNVDSFNELFLPF